MQEIGETSHEQGQSDSADGTVNPAETHVEEKIDRNGEDGRAHAHTGDQDEASRLKDLAADVRDQDDLERDVGRQVRPLHRITGTSLLSS